MFAAPVDEVLPTTRLAGTCTAGAVVSTTLTVNEAVPVFPAASVAVQLTVVEPSTNVLFGAGEQEGLIAPSTASSAVAAP